MTNGYTVKGCCPLDCQDTCSWVAHVEDGRVVSVEGAKDHPITRGVLCAKVRDYERRVTASDRLLYPMRRSGAKGDGRFERIAWDEALDHVAGRFRSIVAEHGAEALMPFHYLGSMGTVQRMALMRVFHALGATQIHGGVCAASASALLAEGHPIGIDPEEMIEAELIVLWGQNVLSTCHHQWHFIEEARRRGARVIAIDPRLTRTAKLCDRHLAPIAGSDAVLAAAIARVLLTEGLADLELASLWVADLDAYRDLVMPWTLARAARATGLTEAAISELAHDFARARPALIRAGIAPMQTVNGEAFVRGLSAIAILGGHWRRKGGGLSILSLPAFSSSKAGRPDLMTGISRSLDMAKLGELLDDPALTPPIKGLMVWSANPAVTQIDGDRVRRGLGRDDLFVVVCDHFLTDTARFADIVLPATTQFEHFDIQGAWGHHYVSANNPAVAPAGQTMSSGGIMRALALRLGLTHPALQESDEEIAASALPPGWSLENLKTAAWRKSPTVRPPIERRASPLKLTGEPISAPPSPEPGKLQLLTPKSHYFLNSTFANMPRHQKSQGSPVIELHPEDARERLLADGDTVVVRSSGASLRTGLKLNAGIRRGLAILEGKWWGEPETTAALMNRLSPSRWSPRGQPAYNETYVTVEAAQPAHLDVAAKVLDEASAG